MAAVDEFVRQEIQYRGIVLTFALPSADDHISKTLLAGQFYEQSMLEALEPALKPDDLIVDAGANIGNHTLFFAKVLGCRVEAFEAVASTAELLSLNVRSNDVADQVHVHVVALGDKGGQASIAHYDPSNVGATALEVNPSGEIPVCRLDDVITQRPVRLLKIDVEGMDLAVLKGARKILEEDRAWVICEAGSKPAYEAIRLYMVELGYSPTAVYNATDSYLFVPSRSDEEFRGLIDRAFEQMMAMQREGRAMAAGLAKAGRYSERIKRDTLAELDTRLQALNRERAEEMAARYSELHALLCAPGGAEPHLQQQLAFALQRYEHGELDRELSAQALASSEHQLKILSEDLQEARQALETERTQSALRLAEAEARAQSSKEDAAVLLERMAEAKLAVEQLRLASDRLKADMDAKVSAHERALSALRSEAAAAASKADALVAQSVKQEGLIGRKERELADKQRRLNDAHRVLKEQGVQITKQRGLIARNERELADAGRALAAEREVIRGMRLQIRTADAMLRAREGELHAVRSSLMFQMGSLVRSSVRSPIRLAALVWTLPALAVREFRRRRQNMRLRD